MDQTESKINVTVHRGSCGDEDTCPVFTTIDTDSDGGYIIVRLVTDPDVLAAHAHRIGPGEGLGRVPRNLAPEVFGA